MLDLLNTLFRLISPLWEMSVTAAYAAAVVTVLRLLLKKRAPKQVLCLLWLVVFARLLIPVSLESPLSIVPDTLPGQEYTAKPAPAFPGAGDPVTPNVPQNTVQDQLQNQPGTGTVTPVTGNQNPSLAVPEGADPTGTAPEATASFPWQAVIAGVWLTGAAALGGCALVSWLRLRRRLFDAIRAEDGVWEHPAVDSPFILGILRPRIYLPAEVTGRPRRFILCHERAHLRRLDHIVKPVCWVALALHWFNPLAWAAFLLMSRDIEAACDEAVVRQLGSRVKADYSYTLLALATGRRVPAPCPLAFDEGDAKERIRNVLNYRRPALWAIIVSVVAAALAAVCLLTDPVAARGSEGDPDPDPDAAASFGPGVTGSQNLDEPAGAQLDPWMKEILDGERTFSTTYNDRTYGINDLFSFFYGDNPGFNFPVMPGKLAIIDLDRDGVNELVIHPVNYPGSMESIIYQVGYLILHRVGDGVYGYAPGWRSCEYLKADGTFRWSGSAFHHGTGSAQFTENGFEGKDITWCDTDSEHNPLCFVDGRKATSEEFDAAVSAQDAKPEPTWYVYEDGVLFNPDAAPIPSSIYAAPLDAPIADISSIPEDPNQWYKVAELPGDNIWMFSRNHGAETLLRWDKNFCKVFTHTAHTPLSIMPELKKLGGAGGCGPLAVISNVGNGTGIFIDELVVYDLDAADPADYTHDWKPLRDDFNENVSYQYDRNTRTLTYSYQGQTVEAAIDAYGEAGLRIEHDYPDGLEQKDIRLCTGEFVYYRFDLANDGDIVVELTVEMFVGSDVVPLTVPGWVSWTLRFNGHGFDTLPGSCVLGYPGYGV